MIVKEFGQLMAIEGMIKMVDIKIICKKLSHDCVDKRSHYSFSLWYQCRHLKKADDIRIKSVVTTV